MGEGEGEREKEKDSKRESLEKGGSTKLGLTELPFQAHDESSH